VLLVLLDISSKRSKVDQHPRTVAKKKNWGWPIRQLLSLLFSPSHHHQHHERHCDSIGPVRRGRSTCTHRQAAGVGQHTTTDASIHDTQGPKGRMLLSSTEMNDCSHVTWMEKHYLFSFISQ
jgi:hypothetical protein